MPHHAGTTIIINTQKPVSCIIGVGMVGMVGMVTGCSGVGMVLSVLPPVQPAPIRSRSRFPSTHSLPYHLTPSIHYPALRRSVDLQTVVVTVLPERALRASFRLTLRCIVRVQCWRCQMKDPPLGLRALE